jgi:hypothetical protein
MKKSIKIISIFTFVLLSMNLVSCGPTGCECLNNRMNMYSSETGGTALNKKCVDKFGSDIPDNLRGTDAFADKLVEKYKEDCGDEYYE